MININPGKNVGMVSQCKPLKEYTWTVAAIRENKKTMDIEKAIDKTLDDMPDDFEIRPYLYANRVGVKKMLLTEYNETETLEMFKEEGRAEGREEGRAEGMEKGIVTGMDRANLANIQKIMEKMKFTAQEAMDFLDFSGKEQEKYTLMLKEETDKGLEQYMKG